MGKNNCGMKSIGGYFELELPRGEEYHKDALRLNTGRNALEYVLRAKAYRKVYLPYYTCDTMLEPIQKLGLTYQFYSIDKNFRPVFNYNGIETNAVFVYSNYFGLCDYVTREISEVCNNLIIDNSQAFYSQPLSGIDTFYSPRKFFGIPDGSYLYTDKLLDDNFETDLSYHRFEHLLGRTDKGAEEFYSVFRKNDEALSNQPIKLMSKLTQKLLFGIDYFCISEIRRKNFIMLHSKLQDSNKLELNIELTAVPMIYPLLVSNGEQLKEKLIQHKVFVATYWPNVIEWCNSNDVDSHLTKDIVALPIDQRYGIEEMKKIINLILK
jgi:hypothetical protein